MRRRVGLDEDCPDQRDHEVGNHSLDDRHQNYRQHNFSFGVPTFPLSLFHRLPVAVFCK